MNRAAVMSRAAPAVAAAQHVSRPRRCPSLCRSGAIWQTGTGVIDFSRNRSPTESAFVVLVSVQMAAQASGCCLGHLAGIRAAGDRQEQQAFGSAGDGARVTRTRTHAGKRAATIRLPSPDLDECMRGDEAVFISDRGRVHGPPDPLREHDSEVPIYIRTRLRA